VFYLHDFTDYVGRHTYLAKAFAQLGYDFHGMDMRGHGKSEGSSAFI
jgi:acylglycerol lipase